ncbi:hypothetical protein HanXRQr2_Chr04g0188901 [Helianthus annuus]|uniref:Uncharacterized protein n=1 Tax=Helianthus annuus TaxID=4232 RepID=A0A9K3NTJ6_HELAN|nr:hypothetical protein HanXRQr2_Chr04g0188901 [Helianthus annuus]KAJ0598682.1 hypothetical protein HanHA89_Chr04g0168441 [Helianthus annuus]
MPVLLLDGQELYHRTFPANARVMGVRPWCKDEELWYEQIRNNFMYPLADAFAGPPIANEGAHILNPRPRRAITLAGEEVILLSSRESISSSEPGLKNLSYAFASSLHDLGVDLDGQKSKRPSKKKKLTVVEGARPIKLEASTAASDAASRKGMARPQQRSLDDFVIVADSMEELYSIGGKFKTSESASARS